MSYVLVTNRILLMLLTNHMSYILVTHICRAVDTPFVLANTTCIPAGYKPYVIHTDDTLYVICAGDKPYLIHTDDTSYVINAGDKFMLNILVTLHRSYVGMSVPTYFICTGD